MKFNQFFEQLPYVFKLKLVTKFSNIVSRKYTKFPSKYHKYYVTLIQKYRNLGLISLKTIKFIKIKDIRKNEDEFKETNILQTT